jgi:hypothetical protein
MNLGYNWSDLFLLSLVLVLMYLLLIFVRKIILSVSFVGRLRVMVKRVLDVIIILYEPISLLIVISVFVMIKPAFHGLLIGIMGVIGFSHLRNYAHSRIIQSSSGLKTGRRIKIHEQLGIITDLGRLGIQIRSDDGLYYIPYHVLVIEGYILSSGDKIGGYYNLNISSGKHEQINQAIDELSNILISSPYVDGDYKPEITRSLSLDGTLDVRLLVKEESHIHDLIGLLEENQFISRIIKS